MSFIDIPAKFLKPGSRLRLPEGSGCADALSLARLIKGQTRPLVGAKEHICPGTNVPGQQRRLRERQL
jgi:hypothetical protein